jgi:hypothetical protein
VSPRQFGKADASIGWPNLPCCPYRHPVSAPCPQPLVWLVLTLCLACSPTKQLYCRTHRDRHAPALHAVPEVPVDVQQLAAGEREDGT